MGNFQGDITESYVRHLVNLSGISIRVFQDILGSRVVGLATIFVFHLMSNNEVPNAHFLERQDF
jgi:hypothetical protein